MTIEQIRQAKLNKEKKKAEKMQSTITLQELKDAINWIEQKHHFQPRTQSSGEYHGVVMGLNMVVDFIIKKRVHLQLGRI
tara:strand:+ start:268 stop:507 length:240 start_codon:yes stop_codon:yes gene_type:complete